MVASNKVSSMAEAEEVATPKPFVEIICKSSSTVRRFAVGTEAGFALQVINRKLDSGIPLASYIEADKKGEEPISFGPSAVLADYGDGWKLQTVVDEGSVKEKREKPTNKPNVIQEEAYLKQSTDNSSERNISAPYIGRILLALAFILLLGVFFTLALENLPRIILLITSSM